MKRTIITTIFVAIFALLAASTHAQSTSGNPIGFVDSVSCSAANGWTYDPDKVTTCDQGGAPASCLAVNDCGALPHSDACNVYGSECSWNGSSCQNRSDFSCSSYSSQSACNPTYRCDWISTSGQVCPGAISGCMNPSATNYNSSATRDDGSCTFPSAECISRYRWVNVGSSGRITPAQGCASVGASPVGSSPSGICASGENRPVSGYGYQSIDYARGTWGGGNGGGGTDVPFQNGGYRCYKNGQERDRDNTDVAIAYFCDFGSQHSESCPADYPSSGGGGPRRIDKPEYNPYELYMVPKSLFESLVDLLRPLSAIAASSDSNSVRIYEGPMGSGTLLATVPANESRPDVNAVMGVSGNHGFSWSVPQSLSNGVPHTLYFYGTDIDGTGQDTQLSGSPVTIQCAPPVIPNSAPSLPSLSCPPNGSYVDQSLRVSFTSSDQDGDAVRYLIDWDNNGSTDQIVPAGGFASSGNEQAAYRSWSTTGQKTLRVAAEDTKGAVSSYSSCSFSLASQPVVPTTCQDVLANNYGGTLPCTYTPLPPSTCQDTNANNYGGTLPCTYAPAAMSVTIRSSTNSVTLSSPSDTSRVTIYSQANIPTGTTLTQHGLEYRFNGGSWQNTGAWNDLIPNQERQTNASFPSTVISSAGTHEFRAYGSNNGGATYSYTSPVTVMASEDYGDDGDGDGGVGGCVGSCGPGGRDFCALNPSDSSCGPGTPYCIENPSLPSCVPPGGFTITSVEGSMTPIQFLGDLSATSSTRRIEVNPVSGFDDNVNIQVIGIQSRFGAKPLPAGVTATYVFDGNGPSATLSYNSTWARYVTAGNSIGSVFEVAFSKPITEPYDVRMRGVSANNPSITAEYVVTIDPKPITPNFREI